MDNHFGYQKTLILQEHGNSVFELMIVHKEHRKIFYSASS